MSCITEPTSYRWEQWSINDIIQKDGTGLLDLNPAFQRGEVAPPAWQSNFIAGFTQHICHSVLTFRDLPNGQQQSIDGTQRTSTVIKFGKSEIKTASCIDISYNGKQIILPECYAKEPQNVQQGEILRDIIFNQRKFLVFIYDKTMTEEQACKVFGVLNNMTPPNAQELRQARVNNVANRIRDLSGQGIYV